ncbi:PREDICTED: coiled-coil domain-containing protein 28B-like isoform X2 [Amphimedon queenslandica]|nr:PREDICTED: coiled-coil domain-containing protein 28B-like isoform X2 [Amphimedon queenslandica]|eukprot:XP_011406848.1 PREDICTED: coiled-coil domain-containing protein 28B-like isoform X2 [Amphimedon queenslandica]
MAAPIDVKIQETEVRVEAPTPPVSESSRTDPPKSPSKTKGPSMKHKSRSQTESLRESEKALQQLLEDFEEGKLNAFGNSDTLSKLTKIRKMQEDLTLRHFEIDQMRISQENSGKDYQVEASLNELTQTLEKLGNEIQSLHS